MKIDKIDPAVCDRVREIINNTLGPALQEIGLKLEMKTMRFESDEIRVSSFTVKLANAPTKEEKALLQELSNRVKYDWLVALDSSRVATIKTGRGPVSVKLWGYNGRKKNSWLVKEVEKFDGPAYYQLAESKAEELFKLDTR